MFAREISVRKIPEKVGVLLAAGLALPQVLPAVLRGRSALTHLGGLLDSATSTLPDPRLDERTATAPNADGDGGFAGGAQEAK